MGRHCDYSEAEPAPTGEDFRLLQIKLRELESRLNVPDGSDVDLNPFGIQSDTMSLRSSHTPQLPPAVPLWQNQSSTSFPSDLFLDARLFRGVGLSVPRLMPAIPSVSAFSNWRQETMVDHPALAYHLLGRRIVSLYVINVLGKVTNHFSTCVHDGTESNAQPGYCTSHWRCGLGPTSSLRLLQRHTSVAAYGFKAPSQRWVALVGGRG
jgi:hypothetical protein